jgi:hypothetical protein
MAGLYVYKSMKYATGRTQSLLLRQEKQLPDMKG